MNVTLIHKKRSPCTTLSKPVQFKFHLCYCLTFMLKTRVLCDAVPEASCFRNFAQMNWFQCSQVLEQYKLAVFPGGEVRS